MLQPNTEGLRMITSHSAHKPNYPSSKQGKTCAPSSNKELSLFTYSRSLCSNDIMDEYSYHDTFCRLIVCLRTLWIYWRCNLVDRVILSLVLPLEVVRMVWTFRVVLDALLVLQNCRVRFFLDLLRSGLISCTAAGVAVSVQLVEHPPRTCPQYPCTHEGLEITSGAVHNGRTGARRPRRTLGSFPRSG